MTTLLVDRILSDLSQSGRRSLLNQLDKLGFIWNERRSAGAYVGATNEGLQTLHSLFPAIQPPQPVKWHLLCFLRPTKADPQFRTLAQLLKQEHWLRLSRGIYVHPFGPSQRLQVTTQTLYNTHIALNVIAEWKMGFSRTQMVRYYNLESLSDIYSSISRESHRLLDTTQSKKELNNQYFIHINSILSRLESSFQTDVGLLPSLFSGSVSGSMAYESLSKLIVKASELLDSDD